MTATAMSTPAIPPLPDAPLYLTPPSTAAIREQIRAGRLGMIATPAQGNVICDDYPFWAADNGVLGGHYPGDEAYLAWLRRLAPHADRCVFVTAPDVVGDHFATWGRSWPMFRRIRDLGFPAAFVAQDGFEHDHSCWIYDEFDAIFLGGSTEWKLGPEAAQIARACHDMDKWVHMGRVSSLKRYRYAAATCWCHSVDGTFLTNAPDKRLPEVLGWARQVATQDALVDEAEMSWAAL